MMFLFTLFLSLPVFAIDLDQAYDSAIKKNEVVGQSRAQLEQASELIQQYRGAIYPNIAFEGTHLIQPKLNDPTAAAFYPERQTTTNLTLTQPLFRGLREFAAVRRQNHLFASQQQTRVNQLMDLYQNVAVSYLDVLALEQDLRNIEAQQKIYQTRIRDLQSRARRGESSTTESLTAQSTAAALDAEYQIQTSKLRAARENFSFLTGLSVDVALNEAEGLATKAPLKPLQDYLSRIDERPDVKALNEQYQASEEDLSIAKGAHWPTADLTGNYYLTRPDGYAKELKWDVQFKVRFPLYEGGITQSQVRTAASKKGEANLALEQARRKSEAEIKSLHESLRMREVQLNSLKLASDLAEKNYQVLLRDSRRGLTRSIDVQLGLTEYRIAKRTYDQARYQARLERIRLELASAHLPSVLTKEL